MRVKERTVRRVYKTGYSDENESVGCNRVPKDLSPRHRKLMRLMVSGVTMGDACRELGFSVARASTVVRSELFQAEMAKMIKEVDGGVVEAEVVKTGRLSGVKDRLERLAESAVDVLEEKLDSESDSVGLNAAKDILDRAGVVKEERVRANVAVEPSQSFIDTLNRIRRENAEPETDTGGEVQAIPAE